MSVVMATFMVSMIPRASVVGRPHPGGARHRPERRCRPTDPVRDVVEHGTLEFRDVGFHYPGAEHPVLSDISFRDRARADDGDRRQHRRGQDDARQPHPRGCSTAPRARARRRRRRARPRSRRAVEHDRLRAAAAVPVLGHGREQPAVRQARRHRGGDVGRRSRSRRRTTSCSAMPGGLDARIEQGGTNVSGGQRQRLSIARALIRKPDIYVFDDSFSALDLATDARLRAALVPYTARRRGRDRGAARVDDRRRRQHPRARGRRGHRPRHARGAARDVPDLRRDRAVADRREERGMTRHRRRTRTDDAGRSVDLAGARAPRPPGRWNSAGVPGERSKRLRRDALRRLGACSAGCGSCSCSSFVLAVVSVTLNVLGPEAARARPPNIIVAGRATSRRHRLRRAAPHPDARAARCTSRRAVLVDHRSRTCSPASSSGSCSRLRADGRGQGQRAAAELHRQAVARRPAQPGHQRHRQRRAEPAADAEPDAHVGAAADRRGDHDVHDLAAARGGRAHHGAGLGLGDARDRASGPGPGSSRSGAAPAMLNAQIEETFTGHAIVKAFGRQREVEERFRDDQRRALRGVVRRAVHVEPDAAVHDVHGQHPVRDRRGRRRAAGRRAGRSAIGDIQAFIQYSRQFSMPLTQLASMMNVVPVGHRLVRAGASSSSTPRSRAPTSRHEHATRRRCEGRVEFDDVHVLVRPRPPAHRVAVARRRAGPDDRDRRPDRRRQDHARQPDHAVLRARRRARSRSTAATSRRSRATSCARRSAWCCRTRGCSAARSATTSRYGNPDATEEQILEAARGHLRRPLRALAARRLRHDDQRRGRQHQRRREAAAHDRPRVPRRPGDPDPRRGDELGRHPHRGADPGGDERAARRTARAS